MPNMPVQLAISDTLKAVRQQAPLVHNITNFVVMEVTANALLAIGASPLMAHAPEELEDLLALDSALVLNIGTLDTSWIASMERAGKLAQARHVPVVLDPVGAGASKFRTETARHLLETTRPTVVRGNGSEIMALAPEAGGGDAGTRGVDSTRAAHEAEAAARSLAHAFSCVVSVSGAEDMVTDGTTTFLVSGGSPMMTRITGLGCSATALTAACVAAAPSPLIGATASMAAMGFAGKQAEAKATGPGSFSALFLDALYNLDAEQAALLVRQAG